MDEATNDLAVPTSEPGSIPTSSGTGTARTTEPTGPIRGSKACQKSFLVGLILFLCFISSALGALLEVCGVEQSETLMGLMVSGLVYLWCWYDAAEQGRRIGRALSFTIAMLLMIGFPWYLIRVRRYPMGQAISVTFFWMLICVGVSLAGFASLSWLLDQYHI